MRRVLLLLAAAIALGVVAGLLLQSGNDQGSPPARGRTMTISTSVEPRVQLFDFVRAERRVDPDLVRGRKDAPAIKVRIWAPEERIYDARGNVLTAYRPDPGAQAALDKDMAAVGARVLRPADVDGVADAVSRAVGAGARSAPQVASCARRRSPTRCSDRSCRSRSCSGGETSSACAA